MQDQCRVYTGKQLPATLLGGPRPIDGVFATTGVVVRNAGLLRRRGGVGGHRCFILDFESLTVFGNTFPRVLPPNTRKLNCECERIRNKYNEVLTQLTVRHKM